MINTLIALSLRVITFYKCGGTIQFGEDKISCNDYHRLSSLFAQNKAIFKESGYQIGMYSFMVPSGAQFYSVSKVFA